MLDQRVSLPLSDARLRLTVVVTAAAAASSKASYATLRHRYTATLARSVDKFDKNCWKYPVALNS